MASSDIPNDVSASQALEAPGNAGQPGRVGQPSAGAGATTARSKHRAAVDELYDWITTVDHKRVGIMYLLMSLVFMVIGGAEAMLIRLQLWTANSTLVDPDTFNQLFTMHGTTMIFFVVMPMIAGFANYLVPLMIGARDVAFPRLKCARVLVLVDGRLGVVPQSYFTGMGLLGAGSAPDTGWFAYAPLTSPAYSRGSSVDYWIVIGTMLTGIGTVGFAVNTIATTLWAFFHPVFATWQKVGKGSRALVKQST